MRERRIGIPYLATSLAIPLMLVALHISAGLPAQAHVLSNSNIPGPVPTGSAENPNLTPGDTSACLDENNHAVFKTQLTNTGLRVTNEPFQIAGYVQVPGHSYNEFSSEINIAESIIPGQTTGVEWKTHEPLTEDIISNHNGWYVVVDSNDHIVEMGQGNYDNTFNDGTLLRPCEQDAIIPTPQGADLNAANFKAFYSVVKPGVAKVILSGQVTNDGDQPAPANDIRVWVDGQGRFCQTPGIPQDVTGRIDKLSPGESLAIQASKEVSENCVKDGLIFANVQVDVSEETGDINPENNGITIQPIPSIRAALPDLTYVPYSVKAGR